MERPTFRPPYVETIIGFFDDVRGGFEAENATGQPMAKWASLSTVPFFVAGGLKQQAVADYLKGKGTYEAALSDTTKILDDLKQIEHGESGEISDAEVEEFLTRIEGLKKYFE